MILLSLYIFPRPLLNYFIIFDEKKLNVGKFLSVILCFRILATCFYNFEPLTFNLILYILNIILQ